MTVDTASRKLFKLNTQLPLHSLFSPTSLVKDLIYVDETYYKNLFREHPSSPKNDQKTQSQSRRIPKTPILYAYSTTNTSSAPKVLNFQHFGLSSFPSDVAFLNRLSMLNLSNNELTKLPPVINYLVNLTNLNLSNNLLTFVPEEVCKLKRLTQLNISFNPLIELPSSLVQLRSLETLDISKTNINFIPAELMTMMKIKININECIHLLDRSEKVYQLIVQNPFSLFETCARQIMYPILSDLLANKKNKKQIQRRKVKFTKRLQSLPKPMLNYLMNPNACSFCGGIYYQSYITRYRIIRYDHEIWIPIEYKLCSSHWKTNREFLLATFSNAADSSLPHSVHSLKSMLANAYNI